MAWNGTGTYILNALYSPEVNGTTIDAVRYNGLTTDLATGITQAINKNGENSPTANINWGGFKVTNLAVPGSIGDAAAYGMAVTFSTIATTGVSTFGNQTLVQYAAAGAETNFTVKNTSTAASSSARITVSTAANTSTADPNLYFVIPGVYDWNMGVRNSDNSFRIGIGANLTATPVLVLTAAGLITEGSSSNELGYKGLPPASVTTGAFVASDRGKCVYATGGVTIPNNTMAAGDVVVIQNTTSGAVSLTATVATLRLTGTASIGGRTLAAYGRCAIIFASATLAFISGDLS